MHGVEIMKIQKIKTRYGEIVIEESEYNSYDLIRIYRNNKTIGFIFIDEVE